MTPYATKSGVKVGSKYKVPPAPPYHDRDALRLQRALLGDKTPIDWDGVYIVVFVALALIALIIWS